MNKQDKLNKLTWKYFWVQKFKEVGKVLFIVSGIILLPFLMYYISNFIIPEATQELIAFLEDGYTSWEIFMWFAGVIEMFIISLGVFFIALIFEWLSDNWELARKRAKKELRLK